MGLFRRRKTTTYSEPRKEPVKNNRKRTKARKSHKYSFSNNFIIHEGQPVFFPKHKKLKGWQRSA